MTLDFHSAANLQDRDIVETTDLALPGTQGPERVPIHPTSATAALRMPVKRLR